MGLTTASASLITNVITFFIIFVIFVVLYIFLSKKKENEVIYYPAQLLRGGTSGGYAKGPFQWLKDVFASTEDQIAEVAGLDMAVYVKLFKTSLKIVLVLGVYGLLVIIPICATDDNYKRAAAKEALKALEDAKKGLNTSVTNSTNTTSLPSNADFNKLSFGNVQDKSNRLWAGVIGIYVQLFATCYFLYQGYAEVVSLRARHAKDHADSPELYVTLVRDIPKPKGGLSFLETVEAYFRKLHPDTFAKAVVVAKLGKAQKVDKKLQAAKVKLAHAQIDYEQSKSKKGSDAGARPTCKTGFLGLCGAKVDAIDHWSTEVKKLTAELEKAQRETLERQEGAAFAIFTNRGAASMASQTTHALDANTWRTEAAPEPRQVIWENLAMQFTETNVRRLLVYGAIGWLIFFFAIPITFISSFTTLDNLEKLLPFVKDIPSGLKTFLQAFLPQLVMIVFLAMLPKIMLFASTLEGMSDLAHAVRAASGKYYWFSVVNIFLVQLVSTSVATNIKNWAKKPGDIPSDLGKSIPNSATFFITLVSTLMFGGWGLELSRLVPLIVYRLKKKYMCKTEEEVKAAWAPGGVSYHSAIPGGLLVMLLTQCFAVISPIIVIFSFTYFGMAWIISTHGALKVNVPAWESYGRFWPHIHSRILWSLLIAQIAYIGYFGVKQFPYTPLVILAPLLTVAFYFWSHGRFYKGFEFVPLEVVSNVSEKPVPSMSVLADAYTPTCLVPPEEDDVEKYADAGSELLASGANSDAEEVGRSTPKRLI